MNRIQVFLATILLGLSQVVYAYGEYVFGDASWYSGDFYCCPRGSYIASINGALGCKPVFNWDTTMGVYNAVNRDMVYAERVEFQKMDASTNNPAYGFRNPIVFYDYNGIPVYYAVEYQLKFKLMNVEWLINHLKANNQMLLGFRLVSNLSKMGNTISNYNYTDAFIPSNILGREYNQDHISVMSNKREYLIKGLYNVRVS